MAEGLREACAGDCTRLAAIDAEANPSPWSETAIAETLARANGLVALGEDGAVVGFVLFAIAADESEILEIAVTVQHRQRGRGRVLLEAALERAMAAGARRCFLEVRVSNEAALALYAACGFAVDGRRKDYYRDGAGGREDALLLARELRGASA